MLKSSNDQLVEAVVSALETMAFISVLPPEAEVQPPDEAVLVRLAFHGCLRGRVELMTSQQLGRLLVDNTLASDPSDTLVLPNPTDPLVELLNITCGLLLRSVGKGARVEMHVPEIVEFDSGSQWSAFVESSGCDVLMADGIPMAIRLNWE